MGTAPSWFSNGWDLSPCRIWTRLPVRSAVCAQILHGFQNTTGRCIGCCMTSLMQERFSFPWSVHTSGFWQRIAGGTWTS